jgi:hypothetical protein
MRLIDFRLHILMFESQLHNLLILLGTVTTFILLVLAPTRLLERPTLLLHLLGLQVSFHR